MALPLSMFLLSKMQYLMMAAAVSAARAKEKNLFRAWQTISITIMHAMVVQRNGSGFRPLVHFNISGTKHQDREEHASQQHSIIYSSNGFYARAICRLREAGDAEF